MKKIIYIIFLFLIISCEKDHEYIDTDTGYKYKECEEKDIYYLTIVNNTSFDCAVYCDDGYINVKSNSTTQNVKVPTQITNFHILYKNISDELSYYENIYTKRCGEYTINIKDLPECGKRKIFYVTIKNNQSDTYYIYDNDGNKLSSVEPNKTCTITLSATKTHKLKLQQANGYIFFPTIYNKEVSGNACDEKNISIP